MEVRKIDVAVATEHDWVDVFFLGDVHEGAGNSDEAALKRAVQIITRNKAQNPATFTVGMGDYIDAIIGQQDPRWDPIEVAEKYRVHDMKDFPRRQMDYFMKNIEPIRDTFVAFLTGNHEESYTRHHSFDVYGYLCGQIPGAHKLGYVGMLRFVIKPKNSRQYTRVDIALNHGAGGGGFREGYIINKVYDVFRFYQADYHIMGHLHKMATDKCRVKTIDETGTGLTWRTQWYACNGSFLRTTVEGNRGYFEHKPGKESDIGMLKASFRGHRQYIGGKRQIVRELRLEKIWLDESAGKEVA